MGGGRRWFTWRMSDKFCAARSVARFLVFNTYMYVCVCVYVCVCIRVNKVQDLAVGRHSGRHTAIAAYLGVACERMHMNNRSRATQRHNAKWLKVSEMEKRTKKPTARF